MATIKSLRRTSWRSINIGYIIIVLLLLWVSSWWLRTQPLQWPGTITINKWDNPASIARTLWRLDATKFKMYIRSLPWALKPLEVWTYVLSGSLSVSAFVSLINAGPTTQYTRVTILEWWSIYDIDSSLASKWYIETGAYIAMSTNPTLIQQFSQRFEFLNQIGIKPVRLEGFLYPDTYMIDMSKDLLDQLFTLQLKTFNQKIREPYLRDGSRSLWQRLRMDGFDRVELNPYQVLTLATVVEKEERNPDNKPTVAWIFLNRLQQGMRLDADITLCYGLHQPYEQCPPSFIARGIYDASNLYNTRQLAWIPPTPIANPSYKSIDAVINYKKTNNIFYLHSPRGQIYYGETLQEHNRNKELYLR